jgi:hypothetical protein
MSSTAAESHVAGEKGALELKPKHRELLRHQAAAALTVRFARCIGWSEADPPARHDTLGGDVTAVATAADAAATTSAAAAAAMIKLAPAHSLGRPTARLLRAAIFCATGALPRRARAAAAAAAARARCHRGRSVARSILTQTSSSADAVLAKKKGTLPVAMVLHCRKV